MGKRQWKKEIEERALNGPKRDLKNACKNFNALSFDEQLTIVQEVVDVRSSEFCRTYRNVIDVWAGYGRKTNSRSGNRNIRKKVSTVFLVKKKWKTTNTNLPSQLLPKFVFTYWTVKGERVLCAIPTDVEDANDYAKVRPQASTGVFVKWQDFDDNATMAAPVKRDSAPNELYVLSCRHLFSLSQQLHPNPALNTQVAGEYGSIGHTPQIKGRLEGTGKSHDAEWAIVSNLTSVRNAFADLSFPQGKFAKNWGDLQGSYYIQTSGNPKVASFLRAAANISIFYRRVGNVVHPVLVESHVPVGTELGDSGSAVTRERGGGMFLGMHIAGVKGQGIAYMIPAWQLFSATLYPALTQNDTLRLVDPATL